MRYKVHVGYWRYCNSFKEAQAIADKYYRKYREILCIVAVTPKS
jgi:hypothetical protein